MHSGVKLKTPGKVHPLVSYCAQEVVRIFCLILATARVWSGHKAAFKTSPRMQRLMVSYTEATGLMLLTTIFCALCILPIYHSSNLLQNQPSKFRERLQDVVTRSLSLLTRCGPPGIRISGCVYLSGLWYVLWQYLFSSPRSHK